MVSGYLLEWLGLRPMLLVPGAAYMLATGSLHANSAARELTAHQR